MQRSSADPGRHAPAGATAGTLRSRPVRSIGTALVVLALAAAVTACGSRVAPSAAPVTVAGTGATPATAGGGTVPGGGTTGSTPAPAANMVGTLKSPCSATKPSGAAGPTAPGVSADKIKLGIISDKKNPQIPVPTIGVQEGMQAFVNYCNSLGGINGRQLELKTYDSGIFKTDDMTKAACNDGLFALVGDGSVQDQQGVDTRIKCGLPEVAAYSATTTRSGSKDFFQPVPGTQATKFNVGPCKYIKSKFPDAITKAAAVYTDVDASKNRALAIIDACTQVGFKFVVAQGLNFGEKNFQPVVQEMKSKGVKYFTIVSVVPDTQALLREMKAQDYKPEVIDLGQQYYDVAMSGEPAADGSYVLTNTVPFFEVASSPALQLFETWRKKINGPETSLGVQAFSAGLLFAQAAQSLGNDLTRAGLVAALKKIHSWDAGGMQMTTDPGGNVHNSCYLYLRIQDRKFVRQYPAKGFACDPTNIVSIAG